MSPADRRKIETAEFAASAAVHILTRDLPVIAEVLAMHPARDDSEHRAIDTLLRPILEAAKHLAETHARYVALANAALAAVKAGA